MNRYISFPFFRDTTAYFCIGEHERSYPGMIYFLSNLKVGGKWYYFYCSIPEQTKLTWMNLIKNI